MIFPAARRSVQRQALRQQRRWNSSEAQKKAQDSLATAQATAEQVWAKVKTALGPVGNTAGRLLGSYKEPLVYNFSVVREIAKQIYVAERLAPPNLAAVKAAYCSLWSQIAAPGALRTLAQSGQVAQVGIYGLQAYGIFKIGEIVGRRSLVGYNVQ